MNEDEDLPPYPDRPDCCGSGCAICVLEGYDIEVAEWKRQVAEIRARREAERASDPHP